MFGGSNYANQGEHNRPLRTPDNRAPVKQGQKWDNRTYHALSSSPTPNAAAEGALPTDNQSASALEKRDDRDQGDVSQGKGLSSGKGKDRSQAWRDKGKGKSKGGKKGGRKGKWKGPPLFRPRSGLPVIH